jgi:alcohol dehydrogenase class IV
MAKDEVIERLDPGKPLPIVTYNLPFPEACAKHLKETLNCSRPFIIVSGSLSRNTDALERLQKTLGEGRVVGVRVGMQPHTLYSEVLEISKDIRNSGADSVITLGGGSLIDGAKAMVFVSVKSNRDW